MERSTVVNRLSAWARWKLISGNSLGFPKASSFTHLVVDGSRVNHDPADIDSWCIETDNAVCVLEKHDSDLYLLIRIEYISNVRDINSKIELSRLNSRSTYYRHLNNAYDLIGANIEKKLAQYETFMV